MNKLLTVASLNAASEAVEPETTQNNGISLKILTIRALLLCAVTLVPLGAFAQKKVTVVVREESKNEKAAREAQEAAKTLSALGEFFGDKRTEAQLAADLKKTRNKISNSSFKEFVEKELADWAQKGEGEKTVEWQERTSKENMDARRAEMLEPFKNAALVEKFAEEVTSGFYSGYFDASAFEGGAKRLKRVSYDADAESGTIENELFGKITIPMSYEDYKKREYWRIDTFCIEQDRLIWWSIDKNIHNPAAKEMSAYLVQKEAEAIAEVERKERESTEQREKLASELGGVLIGDVIWATRNVDAPGTFAATPESAGMFYQWNNKVGWSITKKVVKKKEVTELINSNGGTTWDKSFKETRGIGSGTGAVVGGSINVFFKDKKEEWAKENDPCPAGWRVPNLDEIQSLHNSGSTWTTQNGVNGRIFGSRSNTLFLPAAGYCNVTVGEVGTEGNYWSSSRRNVGVYYLIFNNGNAGGDYYTGYNGASVRCVAE
jgi:uncharacterized protein (TIGR02145 family)